LSYHRFKRYLAINVHHLELFYYVVKHRGVTAAARKMPYGIQQPAISGQVTQLEKSLETKLFQRRPFALTPAGAKLFSQIGPFFSELKDLPDQIRGHARRTLRLAAPAAILRDYLPEILSGYKRRYPDFRVTLFDANQARAQELLLAQEIDLAITELEDKPPASLDHSILLRLPLVLLVARQSALRGLKQIFRPGSLLPSLISLPRDEVISKRFQAGLKQMGLSWEPVLEVSSLELVDTYTSLDFGVGVSVRVPRLGKRTGLRAFPLPKFPPVMIAALWVGGLSPLAATFLADVKRLAQRLRGE
jgi:DNA-binding transcriptional LysR family regulator